MLSAHLLLIEDDLEMRRWLSEVLRLLGARVEEAATGVEALDRLSEPGRYDVVITDVRLPAPNGLQLLAAARTAGLTTPFIVMTAFGDDETRAAAERLDAAYLDKPFEATDLVHLVEKLTAAGAPRRTW